MEITNQELKALRTAAMRSIEIQALDAQAALWQSDGEGQLQRIEALIVRVREINAELATRDNAATAKLMGWNK